MHVPTSCKHSLIECDVLTAWITEARLQEVPDCNLHAGTPRNPTNISSMVQEYQRISSTVEISWDPPLNNDPQVDYYHYELMDRLNELVMTVDNTSNTSAILEDIPYNNNLTFSLSAVNCVGRSSPITYHINIGKTHYSTTQEFEG